MIEIFKTENEFGKGEVRSWASLLDSFDLVEPLAILTQFINYKGL